MKWKFGSGIGSIQSASFFRLLIYIILALMLKYVTIIVIFLMTLQGFSQVNAGQD